MISKLGTSIRILRKDNGDTLKSLAEKIGCDWSNLSKVERGTYPITVDLLQKIINVYDVKPSYFFGDTFKNQEQPSSELSIHGYKFVVDGKLTTEDELFEAIRFIRHFRNLDDS